MIDESLKKRDAALLRCYELELADCMSNMSDVWCCKRMTEVKLQVPTEPLSFLINKLLSPHLMEQNFTRIAAVGIKLFPIGQAPLQLLGLEICR